ncbi:MAG: hypothetical protein JNK02_14755 [Planctomycetes bacterium]|nr:hypothetical protein [Planctomycetota bacterium]
MRARRRIALIGVATAILLLGLEGAARVVAWTLDRERGLALDPLLGWRPLPGVEKRGALWGAQHAARTNALGWRDAPRALARGPGVRRALLLGDSYVFGVGVDDGTRVSEALERELPGLEAWNLGVTGHGPDQALLLLEHCTPDYAPDVVVWFACLSNDVEDARHELRYGHAKPWFELAGGELVLHPPAPSLLERLRGASYLVEAGLAPLDARRVAHRLAPPWRERDGYELFGRIAARLAASARGRGADFVCVVIPSKVPDHDRRALFELRARGLEPLELAPVFAASPDRDLYLPDGHWNAAGHALAAHALAEWLRAR